MPEGIDYDVWRIVSSERYSVPSPDFVMKRWTLEDVVDAHAMLNLYDRLDARAAKKTEAQ